MDLVFKLEPVLGIFDNVYVDMLKLKKQAESEETFDAKHFGWRGSACPTEGASVSGQLIGIQVSSFLSGILR